MNSFDNLSNELLHFDTGGQMLSIMRRSLMPDLRTMECSYHRREER
jgi:hypothetical protein